MHSFDRTAAHLDGGRSGRLSEILTSYGPVLTFNFVRMRTGLRMTASYSIDADLSALEGPVGRCYPS